MTEPKKKLHIISLPKIVEKAVRHKEKTEEEKEVLQIWRENKGLKSRITLLHDKINMCHESLEKLIKELNK